MPPITLPPIKKGYDIDIDANKLCDVVKSIWGSELPESSYFNGRQHREFMISTYECTRNESQKPLKKLPLKLPPKPNVSQSNESMSASNEELMKRIMDSSKKMYNTKKKMVKLKQHEKSDHDVLMEIMDSIPMYRSEESLYTVMDIFRRNKICESYSDFVLLELCKCMTMEFFPANQITIDSEMYDSSFYIIWSGTADIYDEKQLKAATSLLEYSSNSSGFKTKEFKISSLKQGDTFGATHLKRGTAIVASSDCWCFKIFKADYIRIVKVFYDMEAEEKQSFLSKIPMLAECVSFKSLSQNTALVKYNRGDIILKQGDPIESLFIVKSGKCQGSFTVEIPHARSGEMQLKRVILGDLNPGDCFGEDGVVMHFKADFPLEYNPTLSTISITCQSPVQIYVIRLKEGINLLPRSIQRSKWAESTLTLEKRIKLFHIEREQKEWRHTKQLALNQIIRQKLQDPSMTWKRYQELKPIRPFY